MIEMFVMGVALDTKTNSPIVILNDSDNRKAIPIWIGSAEASAIIRHLEKIPTARPMTHDLICNMLEAVGQKVEKIEINDVNSDTYYATLFLSDEEGESIELDSRPSDAIAIALRTKAPIYVTSKVLIQGSISTNLEKDEKEKEEFRRFVEDLKPSDFKKIIGDEGLNQ